uniref:Uncharacterized protein n=1 Tax=Clastoptera arizonana TaxID=38151 RepID=A0A1B6D8Q0_9HEMI
MAFNQVYFVLTFLISKMIIIDSNFSESTKELTSDSKLSTTTFISLSETSICENSTEETCEVISETLENTTFLELSTETTQLNISKLLNESNQINITKTSNVTKLVNETISKNISDILKNINFFQIPEVDCYCDLKKNICDVNCCCDRNCTVEDRTVFSHCIKIEGRQSSHHCMSKYMLYLNNSQFQVIEDQTGFFCIVKDNMPVRFEYPKFLELKSIKDFNKQWKTHIYYEWNFNQPNVQNFQANEPLKAGSLLWRLKNKTIVPFDFPIQVVSSLCQTELKIKYLEDNYTTCLKKIPRSLKECSELDFITGYKIIASPILLNNSDFKNCSKEVCLSVKKYICSDIQNVKSCSKKNTTFSIFNSSTNTCHNLIKSVKYIVYHNGTKGIKEVKVFIEIFNTIENAKGLFRQSFQIYFEWLNSINKTIFKRSGHPGYFLGKPVISALKILKQNNVTENKSIEMSHNQRDWLSISMGKNDGSCEEYKRLNIIFGYNLHTECKLKVFGDCKQIQTMIWQQLIGRDKNITNMYISSYGDPDVKIVEDWLPLLQVPQINDRQVITGVKIKIIHASVGTTDKPQAKIFGVHLQPLYQMDVCEEFKKTLIVHIKSSVIFVDISQPPLKIFPQPPVYEVKLPKDFFYPFLSKSSNKLPSFWIIIAVVIYSIV